MDNNWEYNTLLMKFLMDDSNYIYDKKVEELESVIKHSNQFEYILNILKNSNSMKNVYLYLYELNKINDFINIVVEYQMHVNMFIDCSFELLNANIKFSTKSKGDKKYGRYILF